MEIESGSMNFFAGNDDAAKMLNVDESEYYNIRKILPKIVFMMKLFLM